MAFFNGWPWTQFQEQNLDWFIRKLKEYEQRLGSVEEALAALQDTISQDVYDLMMEWLNDGTLAGLISGALEHKEWMIEDINNIPAGVTFNLGDTITTKSANYVVVSSGLTFGAYQLYPVYYTKMEDLGLNADGITDDSARLQAAYNLIPDLNLCGQTILLASKITLRSNTIIRNGVIKWSSNLGIALDGVNISNFTLQDLELDASASSPLGKKVSIINSRDIMIRKVYAHDWYGTMFRLNSNSNMTVEDSVFSTSSGGTGDVGAALYSNGGSNLIYNNLRSYDLTDNLIYLDGTNSIEDVTISNIQSSGHTGAYAPHAIAVYGDAQNVTINNIVIRECDNGIRIAFRNNTMPQNIMITGVSIYKPKYAGIDVRADDGNRLTSVMIIGVTIYQSDQDGFQITNVQNVNIRNAYVIADRYGIIFTNSVYCSVDCSRFENRKDLVGMTFIKIDADSGSNSISNCILNNKTTDATVTGIQDLRTLTSRQNILLLNRVIGPFVLNGYDIRTSIVMLPITMGTAPRSNSIMFGTGTDKPVAGLEDGVYLIDSSGVTAGWRYYNGQWVAN